MTNRGCGIGVEVILNRKVAATNSRRHVSGGLTDQWGHSWLQGLATAGLTQRLLPRLAITPVTQTASRLTLSFTQKPVEGKGILFGIPCGIQLPNPRSQDFQHGMESRRRESSVCSRLNDQMARAHDVLRLKS